MHKDITNDIKEIAEGLKDASDMLDPEKLTPGDMFELVQALHLFADALEINARLLIPAS